MNDQNNGYDSDFDNIVRILDMRTSINSALKRQTEIIKDLTDELKHLPCGPLRDHVLRELAQRSDDLGEWAGIGEQFEDLPLRCPPDDPPINHDEIDAAVAAETEVTEASIEEEIDYIVRLIKADLARCQVGRAEFEALTFCLTGKASYIGSMRHLVAERRGLYFNDWLWYDIYDYIDFYSGMGWHNELCDGLLGQLFEALREVDAAEKIYNKLWRCSAD